MKQFRFYIEKTILLNEDEIWPDGDGPENPTTEDVWEEVRKEGGTAKILDNWNLINNLDLVIVEE